MRERGACLNPTCGRQAGWVVQLGHAATCRWVALIPAFTPSLPQAQALLLAKPRPTACDAEAMLRGVDVVPLTSDEHALRQLQQVRRHAAWWATLMQP